ncbi:heavy metal sensor histidine kinase [Hahella ganghwensis]|uniref:heavy metal sensor histidine kinase n=1 Tax=Hahella ganghwensis TaxID=286420 RepID=UPI00035C8400|nr:heavy metal sensor histidine kinase [Hahella ganghwensis]
MSSQISFHSPIHPLSRPPGLTIRVTLLVAVIILILLAGYGWMTERSISQHFAEQDAALLRSSVEATASILRAPMEIGEFRSLNRRLNLVTSEESGLLYRVELTNGQLLYQTEGFQSALEGLTEAGLKELTPGEVHLWQADSANFRSISMVVAPGAGESHPGYRLVAAMKIDEHLNFISKCRTFLLSYTILGTLIGLFAVWGAVVSGLKPLRKMSEQIRGISFDNMSVRILSKSVPRELLELATSFDHMTDRMQDVYGRLANYSADIAHELRSPLTNLKTQTEVALSRSRDLDEYREVLYSCLEEYEQMSRMIDDMLLLAKTENRLMNLSFTKIDLKAEVHELADYYEGWADESGVAIHVEGEPIWILGDQTMLQRTVGNLISNAVKHSSKGTTVQLRVEKVQGNKNGLKARVTIENRGKDIPAAHLSRLFDRFYRVDPSRHRKGEGVGLGLAIAKSITELHGGVIRVVSEHNYTRFILELPVIESGQ